MKRIICLLLVVFSVVFLGSGVQKDQKEYKQDYLSVHESYEDNDFKMTFASCEYDENSTILVFEFENKANLDVSLLYCESGRYEGKLIANLDIKHSSLLINGEKRDYTNKIDNNPDQVYYLIKSYEKGKIEITYDFNFATKDGVTEVFYSFMGFGPLGVTFVDLSSFEK